MSNQSQAISPNNLTGIINAYWELTKPGITLLVLSSMMIGYFLGNGDQAFDFMKFIYASIGTFSIASGTAAYNHFLESNYDAKMKRTRNRPIPSGRVSSINAFIFSSGLILIGLSVLFFFTNIFTAYTAALTSIIYLGLYTPLKRVSFLNVFVGSIPGALPPVGGWLAATANPSLTDPGMWYLFAIVFLWQIPHVIAIAWLCNDDYVTAGYAMLPKNDRNGLVSGWVALITTVLLIPVGWGMYDSNISGVIFLIGSVASAIGFAFYAVKHLFQRSALSSKQFMFASFFYLPVVWIIAFVDLIIL